MAMPPSTMGPSMPQTGMTMPSTMGPSMTMQMGSMQQPMQPMAGQSQAQWIGPVQRPQVTQVVNPPVTANGIQYGPSYAMQYQKRSSADKSAVKYTGFLPLQGVYEEDTCRIG